MCHLHSQLQPVIRPIKIVCVSRNLNEDLKMQNTKTWTDTDESRSYQIQQRRMLEHTKRH